MNRYLLVVLMLMTMLHYVVLSAVDSDRAVGHVQGWVNSSGSGIQHPTVSIEGTDFTMHGSPGGYFSFSTV